jgi:hypothetical protein
MSEIVPNITITEFKKLKAHQLKRLKCCEIFSDGVYLFTFTNPQTEYIRQEADQKGQLSNAVGGETLEEILKEEVAV